jgi:hypothetical protein
MSLPSSRSKSCCSAFMLVSCSAYSQTLKMEATCSSGTSVDFQRSTRRYIPGDGTHRPRTMFGHAKDEAVGQFSALHNEKRYLYGSPTITRTVKRKKGTTG